MPNIPLREAGNVIDATGKIVTPGLIDLHTHVYDGFLNNGANPDVVGVNQGVTTVVDGGSAGHAIFAGFPSYVIPAARTTVYCFLHIGSFGLAVMPELCCPRRNQHRRHGGRDREVSGSDQGRQGAHRRKTHRERGDCRCQDRQENGEKMSSAAHDPYRGPRNGGYAPSLTRELLPLLEEGDILSHFCTGQFGGLLGEDGRALPELVAARDRGVILDVANGINNFSYATARRMMEQGLLPTTMSTDVTKTSVTGPAYGLTVTMSKFLELGLPLEEMIAMTTVNPAKALRIDDRKGSLKPGMDADISILEIHSGRWPLPDSPGEILNVTRLIRPHMTVKAGVPIAPRLRADQGSRTQPSVTCLTGFFIPRKERNHAKGETRYRTGNRG